ncbi:hypothetical protein ABZ671_24965 [Micromonospora sp. NPDC006766]
MFLRRAVRVLAEAGIRQFHDLGSVKPHPRLDLHSDTWPIKDQATGKAL